MPSAGVPVASETEICNQALNALGHTIQIASLTERSKEGKLCAVHYPQVRDELLAMHPWPFARKAVALAPVADTPLPGWAFQYAYPAGCLRAWRVCDEDGVRSGWRDLCRSWDWRTYSYASSPIPFELTAGAQQTCIATDLDDAYLLYTAKITDTTRYSPLFVNALAQMLGARLAMPLAVNERRKQLADNAAYTAMQYAIGEMLNEGVDDPADLTPSIAARG